MTDNYVEETEESGRSETLVNVLDELERKEKQLSIAVKFIEFIERYNCKVITPKDFNKYEAVWFLIRSEAIEKLKQIKELEK